MKKIIITFLAALALLAAAASVSSCRKNSPEDIRETPTQTNPEENKTNPYEDIEQLVIAASRACELTRYEKTSSGYVLYLAKPYTHTDGKTYESISVARDAVKGVTDEGDRCTLLFKSARKAVFNYHNALSLSLDPVTGIQAYRGEEVTVPFTLVESGRGKVSVTARAEGYGSVRCSFDKETGEGTVGITLADMERSYAAAILTVSDGTNAKEYRIEAEAFYFEFEAEDITLGAEEGAAAPITCTVDTNLPEWEIVAQEEKEDGFLAFEGLTVKALSENRTGDIRTTTVSLCERSGKFPAKSVTVTQEPSVPESKPDCVPFKDWNFKEAMLPIADTDLDGEVSLEEALAVGEIVVDGKGIRDLAGLECFSNAWKFEARDNDIVDATVLKELPKLYSLDLRGNKNLRTFDITGCSVYFEHCEFELTDQLEYYLFRQQYGITHSIADADYASSDPKCEHSWHLLDERKSTDWSRHKTWHKVQEHTKGTGISIVFSGVGFIDKDLADGSYERLMKKTMELFWENKPYFNEYKDYFDIYWLEYIQEDRNANALTYETYNEGHSVFRPVINRFRSDVDEIRRVCYEELYPECTEDMNMYYMEKFPNQICVLLSFNPDMAGMITYPSVGNEGEAPQPKNSYFNYKERQFRLSFCPIRYVSTGKKETSREELYNANVNLNFTFRFANNELEQTSILEYLGLITE